jgi:hypothetical protein
LGTPKGTIKRNATSVGLKIDTKGERSCYLVLRILDPPLAFACSAFILSVTGPVEHLIPFVRLNSYWQLWKWLTMSTAYSPQGFFSGILLLTGVRSACSAADLNLFVIGRL